MSLPIAARSLCYVLCFQCPLPRPTPPCPRCAGGRRVFSSSPRHRLLLCGLLALLLVAFSDLCRAVVALSNSLLFLTPAGRLPTAHRNLEPANEAFANLRQSNALCRARFRPVQKPFSAMARLR